MSNFYVGLVAVTITVWAFGFGRPLLAVGVGWSLMLGVLWILEGRDDLRRRILRRATILRRRFQFNLRALLLFTAGIGLLLGAEMVIAEPSQWKPSDFMMWFAVTRSMHMGMSFAGWMSVGWALGMPTRRSQPYAAYGACIGALLIVGRVIWFLSNPLNYFPRHDDAGLFA